MDWWHVILGAASTIAVIIAYIEFRSEQKQRRENWRLSNDITVLTRSWNEWVNLALARQTVITTQTRRIAELERRLRETCEPGRVSFEQLMGEAE